MFDDMRHGDGIKSFSPCEDSINSALEYLKTALASHFHDFRVNVDTHSFPAIISGVL